MYNSLQGNELIDLSELGITHTMAGTHDLLRGQSYQIFFLISKLLKLLGNLTLMQ